MSQVTLTSAMRANLLSLQQTGTQLDTAQLDLSTGNKVNTALDNPVNFFAAQALNTRASKLSSLLDGMGQAVSTIQAANQGITSITTLVNQLTSIANSATQDLANATTLFVQAPAAAANGLATAAASSFLAADAGTLVLNPTGGGAQATFTVTAGESLQTVVNQINQDNQFTATVVTGTGSNTLLNGVVCNEGSSYLQITSNNNLIFTTTGSTAVTLTGLGLPAAGNAIQEVSGSSAADNTNFTNVVSQIQALTADSNYQGNNLLNGVGAASNVIVQVNESDTNSITISNQNITTAAAGLNLAAQNVSNTAGIAAATTAITAALAKLQTVASGFAANLGEIQTRQDFATNLVNTLQDGASLLTIADKNQEGADLLALQTQQQLGIQALSLSSQANQSVLRLFS